MNATLSVISMPMCYMNYYILVTAVFLKLNKICLKGYTSKRNIAASKEQYKKNTNYFMLSESEFHSLFCLKFSFKLVTFLRVCKKTKVTVFFLNTVYNIL